MFEHLLVFLYVCKKAFKSDEFSKKVTPRAQEGAVDMVIVCKNGK